MINVTIDKIVVFHFVDNIEKLLKLVGLSMIAFFDEKINYTTQVFGVKGNCSWSWTAY